MPKQDLNPCLSTHSTSEPGHIGAWRLMPNQAMGIRTRRPGQILVVRGQARITWEGACTHHPGPERDHVLQAGEVLPVPAHARVVLESSRPEQVLDFEWRPLPGEAFWRVDAGSLSDLWGRWWLASRQLSCLSLAIGQRVWRLGARRLTMA